MKRIYVFSCSAGTTGERVTRATMSQFDDSEVAICRKSHLRTADDIRAAVDAVVAEPGLIAYTIVDPELAVVLRDEADRQGLRTVDLISPMINELKEYLGHQPTGKPGVIYKVDDQYLEWLDAINFTVKHDDGQRSEDLHRADIILVGVSRTSKTPLSMYLATRGYSVANVPLVEGISPPKELFEVDQRRVVGLTVSADQLVKVRQSRMSKLHQSSRRSYATYEAVESELRFAKKLYHENPSWSIINMTDKAIEEAAAEIMKLTASLKIDKPSRSSTNGR